MLSSPKKPSDKQTVGVPAWHPNFRNPERLPDIKVVRTAFSLNALAVIVVVVLLGYTAYREYHLYELRFDTEVALANIQSRKPESEGAVVLFKSFQEEEKKVMALSAFLGGSKLMVSDFVLELGRTLPDEILLNGIDSRPAAVTLRGTIKGAADEASGRAVAYVESIRENPKIGGFFETVTLTNIVRDPATGLIQFVIDLKGQDAPVKKPTGSKK
jgi:hypothetical protein